MDYYQIAAMIILAVFYAAYFIKMLIQRNQGIRTHQIGRGKKAKRTMMIEKIMGIATLCVVAAELYSIFQNSAMLQNIAIRSVGLLIAAAGVLLFIGSMTTMRDSWRAGISSDKTALVTTGLYRFSRNPAFLGFDLTYIGLLVAFFNPIHFLFAAFAAIMLHLQIRQEEEHLITVFGVKYTHYMATTGRYLIR